MTLRLAVLVFAATSALASPAAAQTWQAATGEVAKLGLQAVVCRGEFCLGVACRGGRTELVSMSPGGGPFDGPTTVSVGSVREAATFVEDPKIMDALNMMGTRAPVSPVLIGAMLGARDISIVGNTLSDRMTAKFAMTGFARIAPAVSRACGVGPE